MSSFLEIVFIDGDTIKIEDIQILDEVKGEGTIQETIINPIKEGKWTRISRAIDGQISDYIVNPKNVKYIKFHTK